MNLYTIAKHLGAAIVVALLASIVTTSSQAGLPAALGYFLAIGINSLGWFQNIGNK